MRKVPGGPLWLVACRPLAVRATCSHRSVGEMVDPDQSSILGATQRHSLAERSMASTTAWILAASRKSG